MIKVHVITDSDSSLSPELAAQHNIKVVPITIQFGEETYTTGVDIDDKLLFEKIDKMGKLPTTAAPSPGAFVSAFQEAFNAGAESIICICVSSKVSSTYESALLAAKEFPKKKISIVDSLYMSMGQGFLALAAADALASGASHEDAIRLAESMIPHLDTFASFSTLKYLAMSGRVGKLAAGMAGMLNIRPLLTMKDGTLQMLEKVRTHNTAMTRLVDLIVTSVGNKTIERIAIYHINNLADAMLLETHLQQQLKLPAEVLITEFTPGLSVHAGSGMVGAVFLTK